MGEAPQLLRYPAVVSISADVNLASVTHVAVAVCEAGVAGGDNADP